MADVAWCDAEERAAEERDAEEPGAEDRCAAAVAAKAMTAATAMTTPVMSMVSFLVGRTGERPLHALIVTGRRLHSAARDR